MTAPPAGSVHPARPARRLPGAPGRRWWGGVALAGLAALLLGATAAAAAEEEAPGEPAIVVEGEPEVVRPGEGRGGAALSGSGYLPGARTRIDLEKYRGTQRTVADVLREAPGVTVVQSGDSLAPAKVTIRGSRPDQVLVLLDGVPLNRQTDNPAGGRRTGRQGVDLATLNLDGIASIEILRGPATSLYGPEAAAGVILIRTRPPDRPGVELRRTVGTGGLRENEGRWVQPLGDATLTVRLNHRRSDGAYLFFDPAADDPAVTTSPEAEACAPLQDNGYRLRRCNARTIDTLGLTLHRGAAQRWTVERERSLQEGLGGVLDPRPYGREEQTRTAAGFADEWALEGERRAGVALDGARLDGNRTENTGLPGDALENDHSERRAGGEGWFEHWWGAQQLRYGGSLRRETLEDRYFTAGRTQQALYGRWNGHLARGALEGSLRHDDLSDQGGSTTYRLGASHFVAGGFGVKASHGTGFRPPTLYELYDPGSPAGPSPANPDLEPETSRSSDGGFFYELQRRFYGEALAFRQDVRNDIVAVADPVTTSLFRFENVSRTRSTGWETSLSVRGGFGLSLDASWTRMDAIILENDRDDPRDNGNRVPGVAREQGSAGISWQREGWRPYLAARYSGRRYIDTANSRFLEPYLVWDGGLVVPLGHGFSGALEGKNLTNEAYAELENFPPPGRALLLTLRWRFPPAPGTPPPARSDQKSMPSPRP